MFPIFRARRLHWNKNNEGKTSIGLALISTRLLFVQTCNKNFPGLNLTLTREEIMQDLPVRGLRPNRSVCCQQAKEPNP